MKKYIITLFLFCSSLFGQTSTNKIYNMAVIYDVNSRLTVLGGTTSLSNLNTTGFGSFGSVNSVVTHSLISSNAGNATANVRNASPTGQSGFVFKDALGADSAAIYFDNSTSNLVIRDFPSSRRIQISVDGGNNFLYIQSGVTTNVFAFVSGSLNTTNFMINGVRGKTGSYTNLGPGVGSSNVFVFAEGALTNQFTIP